MQFGKIPLRKNLTQKFHKYGYYAFRFISMRRTIGKLMVCVQFLMKTFRNLDNVRESWDGVSSIDTYVYFCREK